MLRLGLYDEEEGVDARGPYKRKVLRSRLVRGLGGKADAVLQGVPDLFSAAAEADADGDVDEATPEDDVPAIYRSTSACVACAQRFPAFGH